MKILAYRTITRGLSKNRLFVFLCIGVMTATCMVTTPVSILGQTATTPPTSAQNSNPLKIELPNPIAAAVNSNSPDIASGAVWLDGRKLFVIATLAVRNQPNQPQETLPIQDRVEKIETTLSRIASSEFNPKTLQVKSEIEPQSGLPILSVNNSYVMTVTALDAQLHGQTPERRAGEIAQIIQEALLTARQERQLDFLLRQALVTGLIVLVMILGSWVVTRIQQNLNAQEQTNEAQEQNDNAPVAVTSDISLSPIDLSPVDLTTINQTDAPVITSVQEQMNRRQRKNLKDIRRRLLQLLQVGIWTGGGFAILGLFPYTRGFRPFIFSIPLKVLGVLLAIYLIIRSSNVLIDRFFSALAAEQFLAPEKSQRLALRISTFSRVLRNMVAFFCISAGLLSFLSLIGVELGPVLAGAGILGLAVSFASQNLIKDMINGLLILAEDQYAVGDVIQVGKVSGLVEHMNLRITQLRNSEGRLISIPNSAITIVENLSKDWSRVDLAITLAYDEDIDRAIALIRQVGNDMSQDLNWEKHISDPPEVLGVDEIGSAGITIRIWIKTVPLQQWSVAREFRRRLKLALDQQGIAIGVPQQSLRFHNPPSPDPSVNEEIRA